MHAQKGPSSVRSRSQSSRHSTLAGNVVQEMC